jgi:hypothetical protein
MTMLIALLQDSRLTLRDILSDIPRDLEAFLVYLMFVAIVVFIWRGSRERGTRGTSLPPETTTPASRGPERRD